MKFGNYFKVITLVLGLVSLSQCNKVIDMKDRVLLGLSEMGTSRGAQRPRGNVRISSENGNFVTETGFLDVQVVLTVEPTTSVTVPLLISDTTEASLDKTSLEFTPSNWNAPQTVRILGKDDQEADGNQDVNLIVNAVLSLDEAYNGLTPEPFPFIVLDGMTYSIVVSPKVLWTRESGTVDGISTSAEFFVGLSVQPKEDVVINPITSQNTQEGTLDKSSVTFTAANWNIPQKITVNSVNDGVEDGNKTYQITIAPATSGDPNYNNFLIDPVSVTNIDAQASIVVSPTTMELVEGGDGAWNSDGGEWGYYQRRFGVRLLSNPSANVTIPISVADGNRLSLDRTSLTFTNANGTTIQYVIVSAVNNATIDPNTPVLVQVGPATSTDVNFNGKRGADVSVSIEDNDGPGIRVSNMSRVTTEAGQDATYRVVLNRAPASGSTVTVTFDDQFDIRNLGRREGSINPSVVQFNDTNWDTPRTITVTPNQDFEVDGDKQWIINTLPAVSNDPEYNGLKGRNVTVTNLNSDIQGIRVTINAGTESTLNTTSGEEVFTGLATDESGNFGSTYSRFGIRLRSKPLADVTISLNNSNTGVADMDKTSLLFTPTNWNEVQEVRVTGKPDPGTITSIYTISTTLTSSDTFYTNAGTRRPSFTIRSCDNDANEITWCTLSGGADMATRTSVSESGTSISFYLITKTQPVGDLSVNLASEDTTEGVVSPATLTLNATNFNTLQVSNRVTVTGVADALIDGDQNYNVTATASSPVHGSPFPMRTTDSTQRYVISQSGQTSEANPGPAGQSATITLRLAIEPTSDVSFAISCSPAVECDSVSPTSLTFTTGNWSTNQTVSVFGADDSFADGNRNITVSFVATSVDTRFNGGGANFTRTITNVDNEPPAKAIYVTSASFNGELGATGVASADNLCNNQSPKPSGTFKAMLVTQPGVTPSTSRRVATTTGTDATGQHDWVLKPSHQYFLSTCAGSCSGGITNNSGDAGFTRILTADANGLFSSMERAFAAGGVEFWTGLSANLTTATTPGAANNCDAWRYVNEDGNPGNVYSGRFGVGGTTTLSDAVSSGESLCSVQRRIICVQQ